MECLYSLWDLGLQNVDETFYKYKKRLLSTILDYENPPSNIMIAFIHFPPLQYLKYLIIVYYKMSRRLLQNAYFTT